MTGREAIQWHLEKYGFFTAELVVKSTGVSDAQVRSASHKMHKNGEITLKERRWRTNVYVEALDEENRPIDRSGINTIFQECKNSPAMNRVLAVYNRPHSSIT